MSRSPAGMYASPAVALVEAVKLLGGQAATARLLNVTQPTVWRWINSGRALLADHVLKVEEATGISRHDLNPVVYPREAELQPALTPATVDSPEPAR